MKDNSAKIQQKIEDFRELGMTWKELIIYAYKSQGSLNKAARWLSSRGESISQETVRWHLMKAGQPFNHGNGGARDRPKRWLTERRCQFKHCKHRDKRLPPGRYMYHVDCHELVIKAAGRGMNEAVLHLRKIS